jgi:DNA polymerase-3 subunit delta'
MLIGHQRIWDFLTQSAQKNRLAHAYLFVGPSEVGKKTLAREFAKWLLCQKKSEQRACNSCRSCLDIEKNQHPDVFVLSPRQEEKRGVTKTFEIGIEEIKSLQHQLSLFSFSAPYKIAIVDETASLTREATNSFLKTLEEPSHNSLIILISSAWQMLLPTIISRCQLIKFLPAAEKEITAALKPMAKRSIDLEKIVKLAAGRPGRAIKLIEDPEVLNQQQVNLELIEKIFKSDLAWRWDLARQLTQNLPHAQEFIAQWLLWFRDGLLKNFGCEDLMIDKSSFDKLKHSPANLLNLIKEVQRTQAILYNTSFNSRLAFEVLMTKMTT